MYYFFNILSMRAHALLSIGCYCHFFNTNTNMRTLAVGLSALCRDGSPVACALLATR